MRTLMDSSLAIGMEKATVQAKKIPGIRLGRIERLDMGWLVAGICG